jgi:predicted nicotinamide N-methyase
MIDRTGFILANTRLLAPPLVPEIRLHLAEESLPIWRKTEEELGEMGLPPPYWAFAWAGGQALARHILDHAGKVAGKRVIDIGAGSGIAAIAAAKAGAREVVAADIDALAVAAMGLNASANAVAIVATTDDWLSIDAPQSEIVLVGDLFYERPLAERVMAFVRQKAAAGSVVLVGDPRRSYFPTDAFEAITHYEVPVTRELEDAEIKRAAVWQLRA